MKSIILTKFITLLLSASICLKFTEGSMLEQHQIDSIEKSSDFDMFQDFRTPKKIGFSVLVGGSSHSHWVISILDELYNRGHEVSFITKDDHMRFTKKYPHIKTVSVGPKQPFSDYFTKVDSRIKDPVTMGLELMELIHKSFKKDFLSIQKLIRENRYDALICDAFNLSCIEAAYKEGIPFVITFSFPHSPDSSAPYINSNFFATSIPTTEYMGFWERFIVKVVNPIKFFWRASKKNKGIKQVYKSLGLEITSSPFDKWKNSMKIFNTAFGIAKGRSLGPLVEFVGPFVQKKIQKLSPELEFFLNRHNRVVYVAFGQHAKMNNHDAKLISTALLEAYEKGHIDGVIWPIRGFEKLFPKYLVTQSNTTYDVSKLFSHNDESDILLVDWAPQMAILQHPSTITFISHGGSASLYESLYSGVRLVFYPFFGDQIGAADTGEKNGYGFKLDFKATQEEANSIIEKVVLDRDNKLQKNADRFKALLQIRAKNAVIRGADLVEESTFMSMDGKITHRKDVRYNMSFIKAYNLDVYAFTFLFVVLDLYLSSLMFFQFVTSFLNKKKEKTL